MTNVVPSDYVARAIQITRCIIHHFESLPNAVIRLAPSKQTLLRLMNYEPITQQKRGLRTANKNTRCHTKATIANPKASDKTWNANWSKALCTPRFHISFFLSYENGLFLCEVKYIYLPGYTNLYKRIMARNWEYI